MPRARFKPLTLGSLPRVFVAILAMDPVDVNMIATAIAEDVALTSHLRECFQQMPHLDTPNADNLARLFDAILQLSKEHRGIFVRGLNRLLDELLNQDAFGTEGQCDPRGDHRD